MEDGGFCRVLSGFSLIPLEKSDILIWIYIDYLAITVPCPVYRRRTVMIFI